MSDRATVALSVSTAGLVVAVYSAAMPTLADTRGQTDDRGHLRACEQYAAIVAGAVVLTVAAATRSPEAAAIGLVAVVGMSAVYHNAIRATP